MKKLHSAPPHVRFEWNCKQNRIWRRRQLMLPGDEEGGGRLNEREAFPLALPDRRNNYNVECQTTKLQMEVR